MGLDTRVKLIFEFAEANLLVPSICWAARTPRKGHKSRRVPTVLVTNRTLAEVLEDYRARGRRAVQTELVVHARKGNYYNRVSHKLAHLEKTSPDTLFVAIMGRGAFRKMCAKVDSDWAKDKAARRAKIRKLKHDTSKADFNALPPAIQARIAMSEKGCWLWSAAARSKGGANPAKRKIDTQQYGKVQYQGKRWAAHRLVYTLLVGEIPSRTLLRHHCVTPACVNPHHLELGIEEDNVRDMTSQCRHNWQVRSKDPKIKQKARAFYRTRSDSW